MRLTIIICSNILISLTGDEIYNTKSVKCVAEGQSRDAAVNTTWDSFCAGRELVGFGYKPLLT